VLVIDGPVGAEIMAVIDRFSVSLLIRPIQLKHNGGLGEALRVGLLECRNEWVARFDSDDICMQDRFAKQLDFISRNPAVAAFSAPIIEFDQSINDSNLVIRTVATGPEAVKRIAKRRNPFNHMAVMFKKSSVLAAGSYQRDYLYEDYCLWVRMLLNGAILDNMADAVVYARAGDSMLARRGGWGYAAKEFKAQSKFYRWHFLSLGEFLRNLLIRIPIRIVSPAIRKKIYRHWLRSNV
jgi:glycosyltransferase involved in cell wall biosynthesis